MARVRVFQHLPDLDAFVAAPLYRELAEDLGFAEWNHVVWIGRLFRLDNDVGEHWFDNWDEREQLEAAARQAGRDSFHLLILKAKAFVDGTDGPCHGDRLRVAFWRDVLISLELSDEVLFAKAREWNEELRRLGDDEWRPDLEERIARWQARLDASAT